MIKAKKAYQAFLNSDFWLKIRGQCLDRDGHTCAKCGATRKLQAHHHKYPADWYQTTLEHLTTLCRKCHRAEHGLKPQRPKPKPRPLLPRRKAPNKKQRRIITQLASANYPINAPANVRFQWVKMRLKKH